MVLLPTGILSPGAQNKTSSCHLSVSEAHGHGSMAESEKQSTPFPLLANKVPCCRICLDDDPHSLYSPCRCRGSIKFVHSHCLTRWRKSLMAHGRDESANSCTMCGFNYVLKKRARLYELLSYRGVRATITVLLVLVVLFPSGYIMKVCVVLSGHKEAPAVHRLPSIRDISTGMDKMNVFPICKADTKSLSLPSGIRRTIQMETTEKDSTHPFVALFPGPYASHIPNSNVVGSSNASNGHKRQHARNGSQGFGQSTFQESWTWLAAGIDVMGSSQLAGILLYPFVNDHLWYFLLCRLQHLHLGFFLLGSACNVVMACRMLSDTYDLVISPPHSKILKNVFLAHTSVFVIWFWFSYNLMAFRVTATEEEFVSELPLWALRWINVGVAIVDLSYRYAACYWFGMSAEKVLTQIVDRSFLGGFTVV
ncbi:MAG: hypothetical protein BYD32DRAFT_180680 [Podila humilis]|nr:MAG: hypothetical protein BYD32DRAFT_180680 [Podila humilis]